jgi:hypothetical protein
MSRPLKSVPRPAAPALLALAAADPTLPPAVTPRTGSEIINLRLPSDLVDVLDCQGRG